MKFRIQFKATLHSLINRFVTRYSPNQKQAQEPPIVMDNQLLSGKNVLVTGAGRNIGKSIAIEMAKQGANIFFTDIDKESCEKLSQKLTHYSIKSRGFISDAAKIEDIDVLLEALLQDNIKIDVLINNAGIEFHTTSLLNLELEEWYKTFNTNVFGPMYLTKRISQLMVKNAIHGNIIFITSTHQWTVSRWTSYSASKAALGMIIKELAIDLAPHSIRINGIAPGWIAENEQGTPRRDKHACLHNSSIPPCYIGRAAVYLASDYFSKFTTGTVIKVDAGLSLYNHRVAQNSP